MSENNVNTTPVVTDEVTKKFNNEFTPTVHKIGQSTMAVSFILSFLPVFYFFFVKGYALPMSSYAAVAFAIGTIGIGMWLTEPMAYWPVLGSAGTYIGYLSGNVGGMRFPVALSIQSTLDADISTPRGQLATIIGIVSSVFANLIVLLIIVLSGQWLLTVLPASVLAAFGLVMPCLYGSMLMMRFNHKQGFKVGISNNLPYLLCAMATKWVISNFFPGLATSATAIVMAVTIAFAYVLFLARQKKVA